MEVWISKLLIKLGWCQYDACWKQSGRRGDEASPTPSVQNKSSLLPKSILLSGLLARRWLSKASGNLPYILKLATQPFEKLREAWYNQFWTFDIDPSTTGTDSSTTCKRWPSFSGQQGWGLADWCCKYQCHVMMEVLASAFWKYIRSFLSCIYIYILLHVHVLWMCLWPRAQSPAWSPTSVYSFHPENLQAGFIPYSQRITEFFESWPGSNCKVRNIASLAIYIYTLISCCL